MPEVQWGSRGAEKVFRDNEQITKSIRDTGNAYKDSAREAQDMGRIAIRIAKDNETAQERFARSLVNSKNAKDADKISTEQMTRETTRLTVELLRQTDGNRKLTDSETHKIDVKRRYHEQLNRELMMMPQLTSSTHRLMGEYTQTGASLDVVAAKQATAFDLTAIAPFLGSVVSVGAAAGVISSAFTDINQKIRETGERAIESVGAMAELSQVADSAANPGALKELREEAETMKQLGVAANGTEAARVIFQMKSSGINAKDRATLVQTAGTGFIDRANLIETAKAASKVQENYGGSMESTLDYLTAGATKTSTNLSGFALASTEYLKTAANLGVGIPEAFAAHSVLERKDKDVNVAATEFRALLDASMKKGIKFKRGPGAIDDLISQIGERAKKEHGNLFKVLGRKEAVNAYIGLTGESGDRKAMDIFHEFSAENARADVDNIATQRSNMIADDPGLGSALAARREKGAADVAREKTWGTAVNLFTAIKSARERKNESKGYFAGAVLNKIGSLGDSLQTYDEVIQNEANTGFQLVDPKTRTAIENYLRSNGGSVPERGVSMDAVAAQLEQVNQTLQKQTTIMERDQKAAPMPGGPKE